MLPCRGRGVSTHSLWAWQDFRGNQEDELDYRMLWGRILTGAKDGPEEHAMERLPKLATLQLVDRMRGEFEQLMAEVAQAVNDAPQGRVIVGSEEKVRDLLGEFRRSTFQTALQLRVDAAEAAFSPGGQSNARAQGRQGT